MSRKDLNSVLKKKGDFQFKALVGEDEYSAYSYEFVSHFNHFEFLFKNERLASISNKTYRRKFTPKVVNASTVRPLFSMTDEQDIQIILNQPGYTIPEFLTQLEQDKKSSLKRKKEHRAKSPSPVADDLFIGTFKVVTSPLLVVALPMDVVINSNSDKKSSPYNSDRIHLGMSLSEVEAAIAPPSYSVQDEEYTLLVIGPEKSLDPSVPSPPSRNLWTCLVMEDQKVIRILSKKFYSPPKIMRYKYAVSPWILENRTYRLGDVPIEALPPIESLPDPLVGYKKNKILTPKEWSNHRKELITLIESYEYGSSPERWWSIPTGELIKTEDYFEGNSTLYIYKLQFNHNPSVTTTLHLYMPTNTKDRIPVIIRFGLGNEHARAANERGYAFACFDHTSLDPDTEGHDIVGPAQKAHSSHDWGSVAVWAWGASRVLHFLVRVENIDFDKAVITGHSRTGKAALLAGALETRFDIVVPNGSGAGGASTFRGAEKGIETLELITRESRFKSWFHEDFGQFGDNVNKLPFDQHFMRALIAPRVVLSTDAYGDQWCHPKGVQMAWEGAQPVFDLLGVPEHNLIHFREGGHDQLASDFAVLLDVADAHFNDKPFSESLRTAPFPK